MANTIIYEEEWAVKLQEQLDEPNKWKLIANVVYTDSRVLNNPYMDDMTVQSGTRGAAYVHQDVTITNESITIDQFKIAAQFIDRADLAQSGYGTQMELARRQGVLLNEAIETALYAAHSSFTDFGLSSIGGGGAATTQITVSASNIDDIIRGIKREIREANGESLANRNGIFIVWRPADFELLEAYVQANGFSTADGALKDGTNQGFRYMGVEHWSSNLLAANHLFAGVKRVVHLGIVRSTYGQIVINQDPVLASGTEATIGQVSAVAVVSRVDYAVKAWNNTKTVLFDVNVA